MFLPDFTDTKFEYAERLRDAERQRTHNKLVESALAYRRTHGQASLLSQIAERLHVKAQPAKSSGDTRRIPAV